ncbi:MAG: alpha/beta fold hydrolase [Clostridia bacterium]|nr:alpha/beta fold hydrolase [Clostridia bacterium]
MELWNGFKKETKELAGRELIIVYPEKPNGRWVLKTEYFNAFPETEIKLVTKGYHLVHIKNKTRWHVWEDTEARAKLAEYMHKELGLSKKCVIVGMSCGGMQGIYFGAKYPQYVSCMWLDAPVVNLLSCPFGLGKPLSADMREEFIKNKGMTLPELLAYREHPLDYIPKLVENDIPVFLVAGDSDTVVPYDENGIYVDKAYRAAGRTIETVIKPGCDHHPHGLSDDTPILQFIEKYDID